MNLKKLSSYWYQIIALTILAGYNIFFNPFYLPQVLLAVATAALLDFVITYKKHKAFPTSGIITGLLIGTILGRGELFIFVIAPVIAILSKHLIRWNGSIFNPAAFGILASISLFSVSAIWWASGPLILVFIAGMLVASKVKRDRASFIFILVFPLLILFRDVLRESFSLFSIPAVFLSSPFFLVFFMLTDPLTSPSSKNGQMLFGAVTAGLAFTFLFLGITGALLLALLLSNLVFTLSHKLFKKEG